MEEEKINEQDIVEDELEEDDWDEDEDLDVFQIPTRQVAQPFSTFIFSNLPIFPFITIGL